MSSQPNGLFSDINNHNAKVYLFVIIGQATKRPQIKSLKSVCSPEYWKRLIIYIIHGADLSTSLSLLSENWCEPGKSSTHFSVCDSFMP